MLAVWIDSYGQPFGEDHCHFVDCEIAEAARLSVVLVGCLAFGVPAFVKGEAVPVGSHDGAAFCGFALLGQWVACVGFLVVVVGGSPHGDWGGSAFEAVGVYEFFGAVGEAGGVKPDSFILLLGVSLVWAVDIAYSCFTGFESVMSTMSPGSMSGGLVSRIIFLMSRGTWARITGISSSRSCS